MPSVSAASHGPGVALSARSRICARRCAISFGIGLVVILTFPSWGIAIGHFGFLKLEPFQHLGYPMDDGLQKFFLSGKSSFVIREAHVHPEQNRLGLQNFLDSFIGAACRNVIDDK